MSIEDRNLRPGQILVGRYHKKDHRCEVVKGAEGKVAFRVGGKEYGSPSAAGSAVIGGTACNGWRWWSIEGAEPVRKPGTRAAAPRKAPAKLKPAARPKGHAKKARKIVGGSNGEQPVPAEKPINCGDCGAEFPTSRGAADHMRDEHRSVEAAAGS